MKPRFRNKTVLVTGAGSGIGQTTALAFAREGATVAVNDISEKAAGETSKKIKSLRAQTVTVVGDISKAADCERMIRETIKQLGNLDILVNNAGIGVSGTAMNTGEDTFDDIMRVNVKGTWLLSRAALRRMIPKKRGVIVNTASVAGIKGIVDRLAYTASKHAVVGLTRAMALDHVKEGIRINCICPGTTMTPWIGRRLKESKNPKATLAAMTARQPMGRLGTPEEMAAGILFLASDESGFTTGSSLIVDGGLST